MVDLYNVIHTTQGHLRVKGQIFGGGYLTVGCNIHENDGG
jgi:hypothetical protein